MRYRPMFLLLMLAAAAHAETPPQTLPGTRPLEWPEIDQNEMADRLMDGAHRFVDRKIEQSIRRRAEYWNRDASGRSAYEASVEPNRAQLRRIIGAVDQRQPPVMERFGDDDNPALVARTEAYCVYQVRWSVLRDVWGEGLLVEPRGEPSGYVVVVPDAEQTPEQMMGLAEGIEPASRTARRLAERGFMVVIPTLIERRPLVPERMDIPPERIEHLGRQGQTWREWLYRQSYHMGRHVIGYEVQRVLAAAQWLAERGGSDARVGVAGYGEGGLVAFHAAAVEPRIDAVLVSGYFDSREDTWTEPVYRNVWALLEQFGDAEIATLVAPRGLVVEYSPVTAITGHKGDIATPAFDRVRGEFERIASLLPDGFQKRSLVHDGSRSVGPGSTEALAAFAEMLGHRADFENTAAADSLLDDRRTTFDPAERHLRQMQQIQNHVQHLVHRSDDVRERFYAHAVMPEIGQKRWSTRVVHETHPVEPFVEGSRWYRDYFLREVMGRFDDQLLPPDPRSRRVYNTEKWAGYDVVLDVFDDLAAWGVLLVPHGIRPGERRPVVVTQHGRNGLPQNLIDVYHPSYRHVSGMLAERGFVVFVPHALYRTEHRYRWLNRKANTVKATLYSFLVHQNQQILAWLNTLEFVDGDRIAFYGNSFGGETALRVPPVLDGYALSIAASYFNHWTRKVASTEYYYSYVFTDEWEVPVFDAGHTFDHAELAYLMIPRPFMIERGHHDHVAHDRWVAYEYAKVRRVYAMLGLADRVEATYFQGGHGMRLEASLDFLHKHLDWPPRPETDKRRREP